MADISAFIISEEKWQSMSEAERLNVIREGELTDEQMNKILKEGSEELKTAVQELLAKYASRSILESLRPKDLIDPLAASQDFLDSSTVAEGYRYDSAQDLIQRPEPYNNGPQDIEELLGLYRRGTFDRNLEEAITASQQQGEPLALVMVDLDKFKAINDAHGHPAGDEVLQSVARTIKETVGKKGTGYRYGGEELSILLPNYTADEAASLAERMRRQIETSQIGSKGLRVTASFGVAEVPSHATDAAELLKLADAALYESKHLGRNLVRISGEPRPAASRPRVSERRQPDPHGFTESEAENMRTHYFKHGFARCPRDESILDIEKLQSDERRTPDLLISCPFCGLSERLEGPG